MALTTAAIDQALPGVNKRGESTTKPYKMVDSGGVFLFVRPDGGKLWRYKYRYAGSEKQLSLGVYPEVSLHEARVQRDKLRELKAQGVDPSEHRKTEKTARLAEEARPVADTRFMLANDGALALRLGNRQVALSATETAELRRFLDATKAVRSGVTPCL
jgi:hypothetical protein